MAVNVKFSFCIAIYLRGFTCWLEILIRFFQVDGLMKKDESY